MARPGFVYLLASRRNGTLYLGVTNDLARRIYDHRRGLGSEFASRYGCTRLVWYEMHDDLHDARRREAQMKKWKRAWKLELIETDNPEWRDLFDLISR